MHIDLRCVNFIQMYVEEMGNKGWTGFSWLGIWPSRESCEHGSGPPDSITDSFLIYDYSPSEKDSCIWLDACAVPLFLCTDAT